MVLTEGNHLNCIMTMSPSRTDYFVMVPLNMTDRHCLEHFYLNISSIYID